MVAQLFSSLPRFELVGEAEDGCQALGAIAQVHPDLVILDIRRPKMSGLEVLQNLKRQRSTCRVVVFSQVGDEIYRQKCLELGAEAFFDKVTGFDHFQQSLLKMRMR
jgi:DNA-binding NarL/FixJ family response regulator